MLSLIPFAYAGTPKFMQGLPWEDNLVRTVFDGENEFDSTHDIYWRIGIARSIEEAEENTWPSIPWNVKLYIDGEQVNLRRYARKDDTEQYDPGKIWMWYHIFGPDYFTSGEEYELRCEIWVLNSYEADMTFGWRIMEDQVFEYTVYFN